MICTKVTIPHMNLEFTTDQEGEEVSIETSSPHEESSLYDSTSPLPSKRIVTFYFKAGGKIEISSGKQYTIQRIIDLEEGRIYELGQDGKRWVAVCYFDKKMDKLCLFPLERYQYPMVSESDRFEYTFYKESNLTLQEYLSKEGLVNS